MTSLILAHCFSITIPLFVEIIFQSHAGNAHCRQTLAKRQMSRIESRYFPIYQFHNGQSHGKRMLKPKA